MKKFLIRISLFFVPVIVFGLFFDHYMTDVLRKSKKKDYGVWNDLFDGKINADIVIYGSSRAWVHIDPKIIEDSTGKNAYNLGVDGHNFYMEYLRHKLLLKANKKPEKIILSLDCFTLYKRKDLYNDEQFLPYLDDSLVREFVSTYKGYRYFDYYIPLVKYVGKKDAIDDGLNIVMGEYDKYNTSSRYKGYAGQNATWNVELEKLIATKKPYVQEFDSASINLFERFLSECRESNIKVIFVYTPEHINGQKFVANREEVFNKFNYIAEKYQIPFFDYSKDPICLDKKYFYNSQHLNKNGAELFTRKFVADMKKANCLN